MFCDLWIFFCTSVHDGFFYALHFYFSAYSMLSIRIFCFCKDNCFTYSSVFPVKSVHCLKINYFILLFVNAPHYKNADAVEPVQKRATNWWRVCRLSLTRGGWGSWGCLARKKRRLRGDLITLYSC